MKEITAKELGKKFKNGEEFNMIDVREDEEVEQGKVPSALHIPLGELSERLDELDKNQHYYMICRSGGRSGKACSIMRENGFDVTNMAGGMLEWEEDVEK